DGSNGDAERVGRLLDGEAEIEVQGEERPLVRRESSEAALQLVAIGERLGQVLTGKIDRRDVSFQAMPGPIAARFAIARVDQDPADPGLEAVRIAKPADVAPAGDERLLGRVVRALRIAKDQTGDGVEPVDPEASQLRERLAVTRLRPLDQLPH